MTTFDPSFNRISNGEIPPGGMSQSRFRQYKKMFRELGIESGVNRGLGDYRGAVFVLASTSVPIGAKGKWLGYCYSAVPLAPIVDSAAVFQFTV